MYFEIMIYSYVYILRYINFVEPTDKLSRDSFRTTYNLFETKLRNLLIGLLGNVLRQGQKSYSPLKR